MTDVRAHKYKKRASTNQYLSLTHAYRHRKPWTDKEIAELKQLRQEEHTQYMIALCLGRTWQAVRSKVRDLKS